MAAHARRQILDRFLELVREIELVHVFEDRTAPLHEKRIPAIVVEPAQDAVDVVAKTDPAARHQERTLTVVISAIHTDRALADALSVELEKKLASAAVGREHDLVGSTFDATGEAERRLYAVQLTYQVVYEVLGNDPTAIVA